MESHKITTLNSYELTTDFINKSKQSNHKSKHISSSILKQIDEIFSSITNESFVILKIQENPNKSYYFKYLLSSENFSSSCYDRLEVHSTAKNITDIGFNNSTLYFIQSIGNIFIFYLKIFKIMN